MRGLWLLWLSGFCFGVTAGICLARLLLARLRRELMGSAMRYFDQLVADWQRENARNGWSHTADGREVPPLP